MKRLLAIVLFLCLTAFAAGLKAQTTPATCWLYGPRSSSNDISFLPSPSVCLFDVKNCAVLISGSCETKYYFEPVVYVIGGDWIKRRVNVLEIKETLLGEAKADNMGELARLHSLGVPLDPEHWSTPIALHKQQTLWDAKGVIWYVVAKNGTNKTRPAYPYNEDRRITTAAGFRAQVGLLCRCHVKAFQEGSSLYCEHGGYVTLCVKQ